VKNTPVAGSPARNPAAAKLAPAAAAAYSSVLPPDRRPRAGTQETSGGTDVLRRFVIAAVAVVAAAPLAAQDAPRISVTEAQVLSTFNAPAQDDPYWVLTLQHFSTWRYGSNFFFVDVTDGPDLGRLDEVPGVYLEYAPVLSLGSLGVLSSAGPLRDVGVTLQLNTGWTGGENGFPIDRVFLEGVELAWSVPRFAVFNTQLLARQEVGSEPSWQLTWVYALPFTAGPVNAAITGFLDVWRRDPDEDRSSLANDDYLVVLAQPQVLFALGSPEPGEGFLQVGAEIEPSYHFPADFVGDDWNVAFSPMVRWVF
jgi:hypothetical protein